MRIRFKNENTVIYTYFFASLAVLMAITLATMFASYTYLASSHMDKNSIAPVSAFASLVAFLIAHRLLIHNILAKSMHRKLKQFDKHNLTANN